MGFNFVFFIISSIIVINFKGAIATNDLEQSVATEIEEELKESYPEWKEIKGSCNAVKIFIDEVDTLKELVGIIDSQNTGANHDKCVKTNTVKIKDIIKTATIDFNNEYYIPFYTVFTLYVNTLSSFISNIGDKEVLEEAITCAGEMTKDKGKGNAVLQCLEKLKSTGTAEKTEIKKMWKIYENILEFDKVKNDIFRDVTNKIKVQVSDLNKVIDDCVEDMNIAESNEHTKDAIENYYQHVFTKITNYLQDIKLLGLSAPGKTEIEVNQELSDTSLIIAQSVRTINILKQGIIKQVDESEHLVHNLQQCVFGERKQNSEIFDEFYDGIKKCSDAMEKEQLIFKVTFAKIDNKLDDVFKHYAKQLIACKDEDESAEGLSKSFECIKEVDANYRQDQDSYVKSIVEIATDFNTDALTSYKKGVKKCTKKVVKQAKKTGKDFEDTFVKCMKKDTDDKEREEL